MAGVLVYVIVIIFIVVRVLNQKKKPGAGNRSAAAGTNPRRAFGKGPLALDGQEEYSFAASSKLFLPDLISSRILRL